MQELVVTALWRHQARQQEAWRVHHSRITRLEMSAVGRTLYSGCDAAAPKLVGQPEPSVVAMCSQTGDGLRPLTAALPPANMRMLQLLGEGHMLCCASDGGLACLDLCTGSVEASAALPGTPAATPAKLAAVEETDAHPTPAVMPTADETQESAGSSEAAQPSGQPAGQPEFVAETGFRGAREGYLWRQEGSQGRGYYRKDALLREQQQQCAVANTSGASQAEASTNGVDASSNGDAAAVAQHRNYLRRLAAAPAGMHAVLASHDAGLLFTSSLGGGDTAVRVWRMEGGPCSLRPALHRTLAGHSASVLALALNPAGTLLFSGSHDATIRVWSTGDWSCLRVMRGHGAGVRALAVSPDGGLLYSAAADNTIRAWSTEHWVCLRTLHGRHEDTTWPACLALSSDGTLLASGSTGPFGSASVKLFQTRGGGGREAGACLATFAHQARAEDKGDVSALAFSPDGGMLYTGGSDGSVAAWQLAWQAPSGTAARRGLRTGFL